MQSLSSVRHVGLLLLAALLAGCLPTDSGLDEEREANFQTGRARVNGRDYTGAIESFERALEVNPRSSAAHFELGWLFAEKKQDPAAAIYHYQQYLAFRPKAENADTIRQHILVLKQDLAKDVLELPPTAGVQRQLQQLMEENRRLKEEVEKWRAYYANRGVTSPSNPPLMETPTSRPSPQRSAVPDPASQQTGAQRPQVATKSHQVGPGETLYSIARKYNVKLDALLAANPGLNPRRMQIGQRLNVPSR